MLTARNIISGKDFLIADDGIHDGNNLLPTGIRMAQPKRVAEFVKKHSPNIGNGESVRYKLERPPVRIESDRAVKERVRFQHVRAAAGVMVTARVLAPNDGPKTELAKTTELRWAVGEAGASGFKTLVTTTRWTLSFHIWATGRTAVSHEIFPSWSVRPASPRPSWRTTTLPLDQLLP